MEGHRSHVKIQVYIALLALMIAGGSGIALLISYRYFSGSMDRMTSAIYALVISIVVLAGLVLVAKVLTDWVIKTGRI